MSNRLGDTLTRLPNFFRILLVVGVVVVISLLYPSDLKFKYEFERGQTWRYEDLYAPFEFPILKTQEELARERADALETLTPVYRIDPEVARRRKDRYLAAFDRELENLERSDNPPFTDVTRRPERYRIYGLEFLDRRYDRGIISPRDEDQADPANQVITIVNGSEIREQTLANIFTQAEARELLADSLPYTQLREPEFIYPLLEEQIVPNLFYSDSLTSELRRQALAAIPSARGLVEKGELIIARNSVITDEIYQKLVSFRAGYDDAVTLSGSYLGVLAGYALLTLLIVLVFIVYLRYFAPTVYARFPKLTFIILWPVLYAYLVYATEQSDVISPYLIPFCIAPIVIKIFFNERLALFTHIIIVLIASFLTSLGYEFTFLQLLAGIVVIIMDVDTRDWTRFFQSMFLILASYFFAYLGLELIKEGNISNLNWETYLWLGGSVFLTLLAYPLIPAVERLFGFLSPITLTELSDTNRPLLRELSQKAPGTFQHSLQVGNMSEAAARRIQGADPLLVRTAALYHDIGKMKNPAYFIENQNGRSPHDELSELESARIIISHVTDGIAMAKKAKLPTLLIDFIRSHHGTTRVEYFYRNYLSEHPDEPVDESEFRYPGPRPVTKEETIMMLADSIEAACKSLRNPTEEELFQLIDRIIQGKIANQQFEDSQLSFRELEICRQTFRNYMKSAHHLRIEYPEDKEKQEDDTAS
jgi:putative nucleotidyltransferase with HDIG domain